MQVSSSLKAFVQKPVGRVLLIAFAVVVTALTYAYLYALLAIPIMILVGFAVPIWLGIKRIRFLALLGLVILLIAAPIANVVLTQEVMEPIPAASSPTDLVGGGGGALLQNALVTPYVGSTSTNFSWNVTVVPQYIPKGNESPYQVTLYVSTCPGATGPTDPNCNAGYPFYEFNHTLAPNLTANTTVNFRFQIPTDGIWAWQMGAFLNNSTSPTTHNATFIQLVGDPTYNALEGPVVGNFGTTYEELLLSIYLNVFVYLGIPFYIVLLIYMYIKRRQAQRGSDAARAPGAVPPSSGPGDGPPPPETPLVVKPVTVDASAPRRAEVPCPNCGAVVYPNETTCWKCGTKLSGPGGSSSAPLPSSGKPP